MPGLDTHYFFGNNTIQFLDDNYVKDCCKKYPSSFSYGLQGPDIFFFFTLVHFANRKSLGSMIHTEKVNLFLENMLRYVTHIKNPDAKANAVAYYAGFIGHYVLDTNVHPFVYGRTRYDENDKLYHSRHIFLETDIDTLVLEKYTGLKPTGFRQDKAVFIPWEENKVVRKVLLYTIHKTYPDYVLFPLWMPTAMYMMSICTHGLIDNTFGHKKYIFRTLEKIFAGKPLLSPLIASDKFIINSDPLNLKHEEWKNPWDESIRSTESFEDLYDKAEKQYLSYLDMLNDLLKKKTRENVTKFLQVLGNKSYHSGLDLQ